MSTEFKTELVALLPRMRRYARARTRTPDEADDLVQAACERAWKAREQWKPGTRLDSWVFKIMVNIRIDQIRAAVNEHAVDDVNALESIPDHEWTRRVEASVTLDEVARAMRRLPEPMREVLALVTIDGMSYRDAAAVLDLPLGTVMSRLARARAELMRLLGFRGNETDAADGVAL